MENSFYNYPLLIKQLLISPLSSNPEQEIVDNENQRYDYKRLNTNIHTLANALREIGIRKGDTIGKVKATVEGGKLRQLLNELHSDEEQ